ncbi:SDR family NAD(P)-dependent oxidoreductase [Lentzea cavernae]|uniref:3-oxoacyl-ACP reductase n=1 Tax=Lentzea cavernae TaxID=2020703 RepID=A0ABQ3MBN4_9PSEU|nr:SDR family oxidoreductase [Lentzea cavernae]GHH37276.1 3-oxoacyl-ACP reductase [Lentzea cavernae]
MTSRVALVTGAGSGIGAGTAQALAALGHRVALVDRSDQGPTVAAQITSSGGTALAVQADISDPDAVAAAVAEVTASLGPVEILVNNAGFARDNMVLDMPLADWDAVMNTHLRGSFLMLKATAPAMRDAGWGRIVNLSSISALVDDDRANYVAAKAGLEGFTRATALDLAPFGITVNAIGPGVVVTEMTKVSAGRAGRTVEEHVEVMRKSIPRGRVGTPHDIARAVLFFAAEDADYVTGQVIYVSGGPHG